MRELLAFLLGFLLSANPVSTTTQVIATPEIMLSPINHTSAVPAYGEYGDWAFDAASHWLVADETTRAAHTLDEYDCCTACGADVWVADDESINVYYYDEHANIVADIYYEADGTPYYHMRHDYTYDEDGNMISCLTYSSGALYAETIYGTDAEGYQYTAKETTYELDGYTYLAEYDQHGNATRMEARNELNELVYEEASEHEYDEDGELLRSKVFIDGELSQELTYAFSLENGRDVEWNFPISYVYHYPDEGTKQEDLFDLNGNMISSTMTDVDGNILTQTTYEYEMDEHGNIVAEHVNVDGFHQCERLYQPDEDGWYYCYSETIHETDGSKTVCLYNEFYEVLSETSYDAEGNVVD